MTDTAHFLDGQNAVDTQRAIAVEEPLSAPANQTDTDTQWDRVCGGGPDSDDSQCSSGTHPIGAVVAPHIRNGHRLGAPHVDPAVAEQSPHPAIGRSAPKSLTPGGAPNSDDSQSSSDAQSTPAVVAPHIRNGQRTSAAQSGSAVAEQSPHPARGYSAPKPPTPGGAPNSDDSHAAHGTQSTSAVVAPTPPAPAKPIPTPSSAAPVPADPTPEPANVASAPIVGAPVRDLPPSAPAIQPTTPTVSSPVPMGPFLADPILGMAAEILTDLETVRVANDNRLGQLTRTGPDKDGDNRGFGLTLDHPDVKRLNALVQALIAAEHNAELNLCAMLRRHPLGPWIAQARGVGPKQGARLLAAIGDPYWNTLHNRPRTVSELWAYSGYHVLRAGQTVSDAQKRSVDPGSTGGNPDHPEIGAQSPNVGVAAARTRGKKSNWNPDARMRANRIAVSILQAGGPYRDVYYATRKKYADATHQVECRHCGPKGKPAQVGSPLSAGHQHARALRAVAKEVLKDLWREAKRLHELRASQVVHDAQKSCAGPGSTGGNPDHRHAETQRARVGVAAPEEET